MRVLIVEDDAVLADALAATMGQAGHAVDRAADGHTAAALARQQVFDLVVLDIQLPGQDGFAVLKELRDAGSRVPVLVLTARDALTDRVRGLDLGADDYLTKPFDLPEFEARVRALLRRGSSGYSPTLAVGSLSFDTVARRVSAAGEPVEFSARELGVLELLMCRAGRVVTKEQLLEHLYSYSEEASANAIEVYVHRVRKKVEAAGVHIRTIRGLGYLMEKKS